MEPRGYYDPPCEREWAKEEQDEFYAKPTGIHISHIAPPLAGWPIAMYCPICKETTFVLSMWAAKPKDGDYWRMNKVCGSDALGDKHNIQMACKDIWS